MAADPTLATLRERHRGIHQCRGEEPGQMYAVEGLFSTTRPCDAFVVGQALDAPWKCSLCRRVFTGCRICHERHCPKRYRP